MSDADQKMIEALMAKNKELQDENNRLKQQQATQNQNSQNGQTAPAAHPQPTNLELSQVRGKLGQLIAGKARAHLSDEYGEPIRGQRVFFFVAGTDVGSGITDTNGDVVVQSKAFAGDPQSWIGGLADGYTADFRGTREWAPSHADAPAGVSA
ncbi:hypothetical protein B4N89_42135 [Embleya scabrispora]|uniref:Uncharacterized protein n=1 Tax=Embleya scabrispora TaxID=159449 RepID=A0A1T3NKJ7_9ACTN|nr:hypothetical protein [Embleya scabrispora]OPC77161.1 hypothetical protein B4N89_42135 [Embleya scabrispora]